MSEKGRSSQSYVKDMLVGNRVESLPFLKFFLAIFTGICSLAFATMSVLFIGSVSFSSPIGEDVPQGPVLHLLLSLSSLEMDSTSNTSSLVLSKSTSRSQTLLLGHQFVTLPFWEVSFLGYLIVISK